MQQMYKEQKEPINNVKASSTTWHEHNIVIAEMWNSLGENSETVGVRAQLS